MGGWAGGICTQLVKGYQSKRQHQSGVGMNKGFVTLDSHKLICRSETCCICNMAMDECKGYHGLFLTLCCLGERAMEHCTFKSPLMFKVLSYFTKMCFLLITHFFQYPTSRHTLLFTCLQFKLKIKKLKLLQIDTISLGATCDIFFFFKFLYNGSLWTI